MIINLTPHAVAVYPANTPDQIDPYTYQSPRIIPMATGMSPARLYERILGDTVTRSGSSLFIPPDPHTATVSSAPEYAPVFDVSYGIKDPLPPQAEDVWYIVSLPTAMGLVYTLKRTDVLVPYREVRNMAGTVIGCRALARVI